MKLVSNRLSRHQKTTWLIGAATVLLSVASVVTHAAESRANLKLNGTWQIAAPQSALQNAAGGEIPFTAWGKEQYDKHRAAAAKGNFDFDMTESRCSSPGLPRIMLTPARFKIFVRPNIDIVTMSFEWNRLFRQIDLRGKPLADPEYGVMMGVSAGRWEGDTLVVESKGFSAKKLLDEAIPNSEDLTLVERIRLKSGNTLEDRITITDPKVFTQPWDAVITYKRQKDATFIEDVCLDRKEAGQSPWRNGVIGGPPVKPQDPEANKKLVLDYFREVDEAAANINPMQMDKFLATMAALEAKYKTPDYVDHVKHAGGGAPPAGGAGGVPGGMGPPVGAGGMPAGGMPQGGMPQGGMPAGGMPQGAMPAGGGMPAGGPGAGGFPGPGAGGPGGGPMPGGGGALPPEMMAGGGGGKPASSTVAVMAEDDKVVLISKRNYSAADRPGQQYPGTYLAFDMYRIRDGKIAEHWEAVDAPPGK